MYLLYYRRRTRGIRSKSQVHAQLRKWQPALAVGGSREIVATVLGGQSSNFVQTLLAPHASFAIVEIMTKKRPRMYDGYCPVQEMLLQHHQSTRYFLLPREIGIKTTAEKCVKFCSTELPNLLYYLTKISNRNSWIF